MLRLDKYLCEMKEGSRREVKELIRHGLVRVNGFVEKNPERKIEENKDQVSVGGRQLAFQKYVYLLLNKPAGLLSATTDKRERTVLDHIRQKPDNPLLQRELFPVGRLDRDTEGLLLLTDDGELAHRLLSPAGHVEKTYYAELDGTLGPEAVNALEQGVDIGEKKKTKPAVLRPASPDLASDRELPLIPPVFHEKEAVSAWLLTITEGKYHQVKRMMQAAGCHVLYLKRLRMGPLYLDPGLAAGDFRELTADECRMLGAGEKTAKEECRISGTGEQEDEEKNESE